MDTDASAPARRARRNGRAPSDDSTLLRLLVEHQANALFLIDLETEECLYVSPAVRTLLGHEPDDLIGRSLTEFMHPNDAPEALERSARRREGRGVPTSVSRIRNADERWIWVESTASPVTTYEGRTVTVFTVSGAGERVRAEHGLRAARTRLRRLRIGEEREFPPAQDGSHDLAVETLAAALELRDDETCQHARRVTNLALELTRAIDPELAADPELRSGYLLHDIGKIGIPDDILLKPTGLTDREMRILQMHTTLGEHLLSSIPFLSEVAQSVVAYHHERWDGTGYPSGLRGEQIPLAARIFAVVDAFDAITNDRPYRKARPVSDAIAEIETGAGSQFDPSVVEAFLPIARRSKRSHGDRPV